MLNKKAFCRILKRWFIGWITDQNVQKLQIWLFFASYIASILKEVGPGQKYAFNQPGRTRVELSLDYVEIFHIFVYHLQDTGLLNNDISNYPIPGTNVVAEYKENFIHLTLLDSTGVFEQVALESYL